MRLTVWFLNLTALTASALGSSASSWEEIFSKGEALERVGQHTEAQRDFEKALPDAEQLGPDDPKLPLTLHNLGTVARELGRYPESERYYQRAISIWETHHPQSLGELAVTLQNLGALNMVWGRLSRAESLYRQAYELRVKALGANHPHVGASLHGLAELAAARHRYSEAEDLYLRAEPILEAAYGSESLRVADLWHNLGYLYSEMRRDADARALLNRAAEVYEKKAPEHPNLAIILRNLADVDMRAGDMARAGKRLQRALRICEASLPPNHQQTGIILGAYGRYLSQAKRKTEARSATERSRTILVKSARESGSAYSIDASSFAGNR